MEKYLIDHIGFRLGAPIKAASRLSGGDISQAFLLETGSGRFFCKVNQDSSAHAFFVAEKEGLEAISKTNTIAVPQVLLCEESDFGAFMLMEYIEPGDATSMDMALFGRQLGALHLAYGAGSYGWNTDNFIGSLPQSNQKYTDWNVFYSKERLLPQFMLAKDRMLLRSPEIPSETALLKTCQNLFPETKPSLLHGDLWSGNYLISKNGTPYLIDPAVYFGHHEVDIAMTRLFGGFGPDFYGAYAERFPEVGGESARTDLYQLYYLLVHLNLFGKSYYSSVSSILKKYF